MISHPRTATLLALAAAACLAAGCVVGERPKPTRTPFATLVPTPLTTPRQSAVTPLLPDLAYMPLADFLGGLNQDGTKEIRFTGTIKNIGEGPLIIHAERPDASSEAWVVTQRIADGAGGYVVRPTEATLVFGGHGHEHWHVFAETSYELFGVDDGELASRRKAGFCYFDQVRLPDAGPLSPPQMVYLTERCGKPPDTWIEMGMSVGWSDPYFWTLEDQDLDITGLPDGRYRIVATADPDDWFVELDETNNTTEALIEISTSPDGLPLVALVEE